MSDNADSTKAENSFLSELKAQFEREIDLRKNLDTKTTFMITLATTLITIDLGIASFLITEIDNLLVYYTSIGVFGLVIFCSVHAIWQLVKGYEIRDYYYPMGSKFFFEEGKLDNSSIELVRNITQSQYNDRMFKGYLKGIRSHNLLNTEKSVRIFEGQVWIRRSLITVAILVGFILSFGYNHFFELIRFVTILD